MTEKRFTTDNGSNEDVALVDNLTGKEYESNFEDIVTLMNDLNCEMKCWKNIAVTQSNFNQILLKELDIAKSKGIKFLTLSKKLCWVKLMTNNDFNNIENDSTNSRNKKRFYWNGTSDGFGSIMDNETGEYLSYSQCVSKLNELNNENQELKEENKWLIEANDTLADIFVHRGLV